MRHINQKGLDLIKYFEGLRLKPYVDLAGVVTIGYGSTHYPDGSKITMKDPEITKEKAEEFLKHDVEAIERLISNLVKVDINDNQFAALVSFTYNLGQYALQHSTLLRYLNEKRYHDAANQFLKWIYVKNLPVEGLKNRRNKEKELFETPTTT